RATPSRAQHLSGGIALGAEPPTVGRMVRAAGGLGHHAVGHVQLHTAANAAVPAHRGNSTHPGSVRALAVLVLRVRISCSPDRLFPRRWQRLSVLEGIVAPQSIQAVNRMHVAVRWLKVQLAGLSSDSM